MVLWIALHDALLRATLLRVPRFPDEWTSVRLPRTVSEWADRGVTRKMLRGPRYEWVSRGYYRPAPDPAQTSISPTQRIVDAWATMPAGALITGWAAAFVHGVDALDGLDDHTYRPRPVTVLLPPGQRRDSTDAISYRQCRRPIRGQLVWDVPVTTRLWTALDLARSAPELSEAVVPLDAFLGCRVLDPADLRRGIARWRPRRGIRQARAAVALARVGVRSSWESRLRVFAASQLGLTELEPNRAVFDSAGNLLGVPDLLDAEAALALEYDGATWRSDRDKGHRNREQHREDNAREERLERAGLIVVRVEKADLTRYRGKLAARILAAYADGLRRDRSRDRWTLDEPPDWFGLPA